MKVNEGDGHYMEDAIILGVIFLDKQRIHRRKEKNDSQASGGGQRKDENSHQFFAKYAKVW